MYEYIHVERYFKGYPLVFLILFSLLHYFLLYIALIILIIKIFYFPLRSCWIHSDFASKISSSLQYNLGPVSGLHYFLHRYVITVTIVITHNICLLFTSLQSIFSTLSPLTHKNNLTNKEIRRKSTFTEVDTGN